MRGLRRLERRYPRPMGHQMRGLRGLRLALLLRGLRRHSPHQIRLTRFGARPARKVQPVACRLSPRPLCGCHAFALDKTEPFKIVQAPLYG